MTPCLEGDTSSKPSFLVSMLVFEGLDTPLKINFCTCPHGGLVQMIFLSKDL